MIGQKDGWRRLLRLALCFLALVPGAAVAQSPTGSITGRAADTLGAGIPGVTVTVESTALQGRETAVTSLGGDYIFKLLPPGEYAVTFRIQGFSEARHTRAVSAAEAVTINVTLQPVRVQEMVTVTADAGAFVNTVEGATNVRQALLEALPTSRTMLSAVNLAPSAHATGPSDGISIAGAMSFESLFMVNGVPVQENLRGQPLSLFIEDAIQETTVTTSGISAAYGRFSGGIVNTVTKSGGNTFAGTLRTRFDNDNWRSVSPFGEKKTDKTSPTYEATLGGPVVRDRLWFFAALRSFDSSVSRETGITGIPFERTQSEDRVEVKATQSLGTGQRVAVNYLGSNLKTTNSAWPSTSEVMDLASLTNPSNPQSIVGVHYNGSFRSRLFLQAQYSLRKLAFEQNGGRSTDLIAGTPLRDQQTGAWWWSPNFCAVCPVEERNNESLVLKGSYFLSTGLGAHDLEFGYDGFNDKTLADNHQSGSDYHVWATSSTVVNDVIYPVIEPGFSTFIIHWPLQKNSQGSNFRKHSLFVHDRWAATNNLSLSLGVRYDQNAGRDSSGSLVSDDSAVSPRLGLVWDPRGDGQTSVSLSMSRYVSADSNSIAGSASPAGNPSILAYFYGGAPINNGSGPLVASDVALQRVFSWFNSRPQSPFFVDIPGVATKIQGPLKSPHSDEMALGVSRQLGSRSALRVDLVNRTFADFYSERVDTTTGQVFDEFGQPFDLKLVENTNDLTRRYRAMNVQASRRGTDITLGLSYTLSRLWGSVDGETVANGPIPGDVASYPEYFQRSWYLPEGDLAADQRHRARLWATYALPWGRRVAAVSIGALQTAQSGTPYGATGSVVVSPFVANPGYALPPDTQNYFFTARDAFHTEASYRTDVSINVDRTLPGTRRAELFAQFHILNVFNRFQIANFTEGEINATVRTAVDDASLALFNPFTAQPVEGVNWQKDDDFGQPVARDAYTIPRTFRFSVGLKF